MKTMPATGPSPRSVLDGRRHDEELVQHQGQAASDGAKFLGTTWRRRRSRATTDGVARRSGQRAPSRSTRACRRPASTSPPTACHGGRLLTRQPDIRGDPRRRRCRSASATSARSPRSPCASRTRSHGMLCAASHDATLRRSATLCEQLESWTSFVDVADQLEREEAQEETLDRTQASGRRPR